MILAITKFINSRSAVASKSSPYFCLVQTDATKKKNIAEQIKTLTQIQNWPFIFLAVGWQKAGITSFMKYQIHRSAEHWYDENKVVIHAQIYILMFLHKEDYFIKRQRCIFSINRCLHKYFFCGHGIFCSWWEEASLFS